MLNEEKVKQFKQYAIEEYNGSLTIEDIAVVTKTKKTDGGFIQIGLRPLIEDDFLIMPNFDPRLPGIGRMVAAGERDFLINELINNKEIKHEAFEGDIQEFPKYVYDFDDAVILISTKFFIEVFTKLVRRIDYKEKHPRLDQRYEIFSIPEKVMGNRIIILEKNAIFWKKQVFENGETLDITLKPASIGKVDITIRSVNKIESIDINGIKILEVEEKNGEKS